MAEEKEITEKTEGINQEEKIKPEDKQVEVEKDVIADAPKEDEIKREKRDALDKGPWNPKTTLGKKVKSGEITSMDQILDNGYNILESQIVDAIFPNAESELLFIGQAKGKFGGGKKRVFRQTQKKTKEGNKPSFATIAVIGNQDGFVGIGYGKSKETVPAREKALRNAKLNMFKIMRGCGSWECLCNEPHTVPFKVEGKCGSVIIKLMPAPRGKGLCIEPECAKILKLAGIKDVWSKTKGQTKVKMNLIYACEDALRKMMKAKITHKTLEKAVIVEGTAIKTE